MTYRRRITDLNNLPTLRTFRTELRNSLTPAEAAFWNMVKNSQLDGRKFRRQHSFGNYILDFYCPSERLAIELDGKRHFTEKAELYDEERKMFLEIFNVNVIRFENHWVFDDPDGIIEIVKRHFGWREKLRPNK